MVQVSGPLKIVTDKPSRVSEVWVGSPQTRPHGGGLLVEERDKVTPVAGILSFTSVPGPVLLTLVSGGRVVDSVKGIVPDKASATLAEVVEPTIEYEPAVVSRAVAKIEGAVGVATKAAVEGEMGQAVRQAEAAATSSAASSEQADRRATSAEANSENAVDRVTALEAMSDLSPESPVDGQTANLILQSGTLTHAAIFGQFKEDPPDSGLFSIPGET